MGMAQRWVEMGSSKRRASDNNVPNKRPRTWGDTWGQKCPMPTPQPLPPKPLLIKNGPASSPLAPMHREDPGAEICTHPLRPQPSPISLFIA